MKPALKTPLPDFVLLVEDLDSDAELTTLALKKNGLNEEVLHFKDGYKALDFLFARGEFASRDRKQLPKLILLDVDMPSLSGLEILKTIRDNRLCRWVPVVMLSGSEKEDDIIASYELGVNSFITKPVAFQEYLQKVSSMANYWLRRNKT